jgi:hypothetical protein
MTKKTLPRAGMAAAQIGAVALLTLGGASSSQAQQDVAGDWEHFVDCFGWMITDPPTQYDNCTPNNVAVEFRSLTTPVDSSGDDDYYYYIPY